MPEYVDLDELQDIYDDISVSLADADYRETFDDDVAPLLEEMHQQHFNDRAGPSGAHWDDWHFTRLDATEHPTLEVSKRLRGSLRTGDADNISQADASQLTWGTGIRYAGIHNFGGSVVTRIWLTSRDGKIKLRPGTTLHIPQREFLGMSDQGADKVADVLADATVEQITEL